MSSLNSPLLGGNNDDQPAQSLCARMQASPYWNIVFLALAWALTLTTSTLLTTIGPLSAMHLGASKSLSAFSIGVFLIGAAVSSVPSGYLFRKYGRFIGFSCGCGFQFLGSVLGSLAIEVNDLTLLYMGCFSIGLGQGLGQFYRFSAVEITPDHLKSRAVTYVLSGGMIAAFLGPTCANFSKTLIGEDYQGSYMLIAVIALVNQIDIWFVKFPPRAELKNNTLSKISVGDVPGGRKEIRPMREIVSQPLFIISCTVATLAHTIMVMIMSNVSLDMVDQGFSFHEAAQVMEVHFFAMFAPGFLTGRLIEQYGTVSIAFVGGIIFAASSLVLAIDNHFWNFLLGMALVGIAWNFSFSAGTVMLTKSYRPQEATEVQAINDFILFTIAGAGSLISGVIYADLGWLILIYFSSALMVVYIVLFIVIWFFSIKADEIAVKDDAGGLLSHDGGDDDDDTLSATYGKENVIPRAVINEGRSLSISEHIMDYRRSHSFIHDVNDTPDEMQNVRSVSVA